MGCMLFYSEVLYCGSYLAICQGTRPHTNILGAYERSGETIAPGDADSPDPTG